MSAHASRLCPALPRLLSDLESRSLSAGILHPLEDGRLGTFSIIKWIYSNSFMCFLQGIML